MRNDIPTGAKPWIGWTLVVLTLLLILIGWIVVRGMGAGEALQQAERSASSLQQAIANGDKERIQRFSERLADQTDSARSMTSDPVWRGAEWVPFVGSGMRALREVSEASAELASEAVPHLVDASERFPLASLGLSAGTVDITDYAAAQAPVQRAAAAAAAVTAKLEAIDTGAGPFADSAVAARDAVARQSGRIQALDTSMTLILSMLVVSDAHSYLVVTAGGDDLNAAPVTATHLSALNGSVRYHSTTAASALKSISNTQGSFADYGQRIANEWQEIHGTTLEGVVAIDFETLSLLLSIVDHVYTSDGDYTSGNIVSRLTAGPTASNDEEGEEIDPVVARDNFFIRAVFAVATTALETRNGAGVVGALADAADGGHLLLWSADPAEQAIIAETTLADR